MIAYIGDKASHSGSEVRRRSAYRTRVQYVRKSGGSEWVMESDWKRPNVAALLGTNSKIAVATPNSLGITTEARTILFGVVPSTAGQPGSCFGSSGLGEWLAKVVPASEKFSKSLCVEHLQHRVAERVVAEVVCAESFELPLRCANWHTQMPGGISIGNAVSSKTMPRNMYRRSSGEYIGILYLTDLADFEQWVIPLATASSARSADQGWSPGLSRRSRLRS